MTSARVVRRLAAALAVLVAGPGLALGSAPAATAATCTSAGGVSVVVDYRELGGGTVTACAADGGGRSAAAIFASVGVSITYATRQPGFVCRVNGAPTSDPCVNTSPANAYWGLWWADGSRASWTYSSYGVGSLTVPAGGSVGWSWQQDRTAGTSVPGRRAAGHRLGHAEPHADLRAGAELVAERDADVGRRLRRRLRRWHDRRLAAVRRRLHRLRRLGRLGRWRERRHGRLDLTAAEPVLHPVVRIVGDVVALREPVRGRRVHARHDRGRSRSGSGTKADPKAGSEKGSRSGGRDDRAGDPTDDPTDATDATDDPTVDPAGSADAGRPPPGPRRPPHPTACPRP
ncbi:hypothetical protein [Nocardioides okcheonensis]|uniref:hypothetical protein n=1 Tax=Nocardioides okcheonensis TaxID=2894081 RepID=UPI001E5850FD|nr:hypothetical protein [Nocardioides okcheonensis]UFN45864.1 hypothetical protein LN652_06550 [Nocardioides okcheonensis]